VATTDARATHLGPRINGDEQGCNWWVRRREGGVEWGEGLRTDLAGGVCATADPQACSVHVRRQAHSRVRAQSATRGPQPCAMGRRYA
jgi:hypothetical protein